MKNYADRETDKRLKSLEGRIREVYTDALRDLDRIIKEYWGGREYIDSNGDKKKTQSYYDREKEMQALVDAGKMTPEAFQQWKINNLGRGQRFEAMRDALAARLTDANALAREYARESASGVYALHKNFEAYNIEREVGVLDNWTLFNENAVRRNLVNEPNLMPKYTPPPELELEIDYEYGKRQIRKEVTSAILSGAPLRQIADRLAENLVNMDHVSAVRTARTAYTSAQNAGRMDSMDEAEEMGIKIRKKWVSTLDVKTRSSHQDMDGVIVDRGEPFPNGLMYPGDKSGEPGEVYNSRCTMVSVIGDHDFHGKRRARNPETGKNELVENMTYHEWARMKGLEK